MIIIVIFGLQGGQPLAQAAYAFVVVAFVVGGKRQLENISQFHSHLKKKSFACHAPHNLPSATFLGLFIAVARLLYVFFNKLFLPVARFIFYINYVGYQLDPEFSRPPPQPSLFQFKVF